MNIIFSDQAFPQQITKSIFLAGPSPRSAEVFDWKILAVSYLEDSGYDGTIFLPIISHVFLEKYHEYRVSQSKETQLISYDEYIRMKNVPKVWHYDNQIEWEIKARKMADVNLFWVPRDMKGGMPALTTNIEFGEDIYCGKLVYGRPEEAEKCKYLDKRVEMNHQVFYHTLEDTINEAVRFVGAGAFRQDGEVFVPLMIWQTQEFQSWYTSMKQAGNRLDFAQLKYIHNIVFKKDNKMHAVLFAFIMDVHVWIEKEQRLKSNEFILSRKDISTVVPYYRDKDGEEYIVLVKEFRSPVNNADGYVWELPGGSSVKPGVDPKANAQKEMEEETGLHISDISRFKEMPARQLVATLSIHRAHPYFIELNKDEFNYLRQQTKAHGEVDDTEQTFVTVVPINELFEKPIDSSMLGMIFEAKQKFMS